MNKVHKVGVQKVFFAISEMDPLREQFEILNDLHKYIDGNPAG